MIQTFELSSFHEWIEESTFILIEISCREREREKERERERAMLIQKAMKKTCLQKFPNVNVSISNFYCTVCIRYLDLTLVKEVRWLFLGHCWTLLKVRNLFLGAAGAVVKIGASLKSNYQINLSLPKYLIHTIFSSKVMLLFNGNAWTDLIIDFTNGTLT